MFKASSVGNLVVLVWSAGMLYVSFCRFALEAREKFRQAARNGSRMMVARTCGGEADHVMVFQSVVDWSTFAGSGRDHQQREQRGQEQGRLVVLHRRVCERGA